MYKLHTRLHFFFQWKYDRRGVFVEKLIPGILIEISNQANEWIHYLEYHIDKLIVMELYVNRSLVIAFEQHTFISRQVTIFQNDLL